ncbi:PhoI [Desulfurococcaceae archaeon MEX13E-LK6-19]|nr:PhoI [Desulfurococcaceae archaeon MEX13E-LK6-19]
MSQFTWSKTFPVDSLQIYFAASLELQEEFINYGFYVPKSPDRKISMPIPLVYCNFRGWLKPVEPITVERLILPSWLGLTPQELGWAKTTRDGKEAYILPKEEVYVNIGILDNNVIFDLDIRKYHLERTSIRGINPEKWTNWAMFYISLEYLDELIDALRNHLPKSTQSFCDTLIPGGIPKPVKEVQQGGKEVTYYVKVPVKDFSFCLGCFDLTHRYLYVKAKEHCKIDPNSIVCRDPNAVINKLKLRIKYSPNVDTFAKVGIAKIIGKHPQIMIKLASTNPKRVIRGVLKDRIEGKARGELVYCDHKVKRQYIVLNLESFYKALIATRNYVDKLPKDE